MHRFNGKFIPFSETKSMLAKKPIYKRFVEQLMIMAENYFPLELAVMIQSEYSRGITRELEYHPCNGLTSNIDGPCSISTSVNFATPQHVDVRDGSKSIFGWFHLNPPKTDQYFLLSHLRA